MNPFERFSKIKPLVPIDGFGRWYMNDFVNRTATALRIHTSHCYAVKQ
jgi:hypothetical protein